MSELALYFGGLGCRRCTRDVTARLRDVRGVETITADHRRAVVRVTGSMSVADVLAPFDGTCYEPQVLEVGRAGPPA